MKIRKYSYPLRARGGGPCIAGSAIIILTTVVILQQQDLCTLEFSFTNTVGLGVKTFFDIYSEKSVSNCGRNASYIEFFLVFSVFGFA